MNVSNDMIKIQTPENVFYGGLLEQGKTYLFNAKGGEVKIRRGFFDFLFDSVPTSYKLWTLDNQTGVLIEDVDEVLEAMNYGFLEEQLDPMTFSHNPMPLRKCRDQSKLVDALRDVFGVRDEIEGEEESFNEAMEKIDPRAKAYKVDLNRDSRVLELTVQEQLC